MSDTRLNVFIQNLKDTTTVLQQLEVCIKALKNNLNIIDKIESDITDLNLKVDTLEENMPKYYIHKLRFRDSEAEEPDTYYLMFVDKNSTAITLTNLLEKLQYVVSSNRKFQFYKEVYHSNAPTTIDGSIELYTGEINIDMQYWNDETVLEYFDNDTVTEL